MIALEAIGELESSPTSLAEDSAVLITVFSFFNIGWPLSGENAWDPIITGGKEESGRGRGMCGEKVLLEASSYSTRC